MGSEPEQCLICLEKFTDNEAYIPELDCDCAIFVHWDCWEPWTGGCLYCRDIYVEYDEPIVIVERRYPIELYILHDNRASFLLKASVAFFTLYFFILFFHGD
jgi:hypothetical protein